ncbi:hypothetical protein [Streptomyces cinereospinus]|uniref:MarR family transcriptional regulator n=1 Tax=Streptomyces cinereospinus TaxID=285561 RepID=A0ABV5N625_9ACTN
MLTAEGRDLRGRLRELVSQNSPLAGLTPHQRVLQGPLEQAVTRS